ncbi:YdeI/OmpD-associated family protein [Longivirga aurantiaca]|uniref:YdeI/OmpD-associated family protein n=1 Tax=Longivirga aurantiaca TaxID=1837743 RepID=A0ABW1T0N5_9ACTN
MRFQATVDLHGRSATGIVVPPEVVEGLGSGKKPAVTVTINGFSYPSTIASMGGRFLLPVSAAIRAGAGVSAGDVVDVEVVLDTSTREVAVPDDLAAALVKAPAARTAFDALSNSNKKRHVLSVEGAKTAETRERRIAKVLTELGG